MSDEVSVFIESNGELLQMDLDPNAFSVDDSDLDGELCRIARMIFEYGTVEAETKLRVGRLDAEIERLRSELDVKVRASFLERGEKATEARVAGAIVLDNQFQETTHAYNQAVRDAGVMRWAMTALTHKSEALRALAYRENQSMKADR